MEITLIILGFIAVWGIGYAIGRTTGVKDSIPAPYSSPSWEDKPLWEKNQNQARSITYLQEENYKLRKELDNTCPRRCYRQNQTCHICEIKPKVYSCTLEEQELTNLLLEVGNDAQSIHGKILKKIAK